MLYTMSNLPNKFNIFITKNYRVFVLYDYSVQIMLGIKEALLNRGYVPVLIGGGMTGDKKVNFNDLHVSLKAKYHKATRKRYSSQQWMR